MSTPGANDPAHGQYGPGGREIEDEKTAERATREERRRVARDHGEAAPASGEVRIDALEASVAAGLVESPESGEPEQPPVENGYIDEPTIAYELPDWSEPATGQVPRILLDELDRGLIGPEPPRHGPTWREGAGDWDDDLDLSFLAEESQLSDQIAGNAAVGDAPFTFDFADPEEPAEPEAPVEVDDDAEAWKEFLTPPPAEERATPRRRHMAPRTQAAPRSGRSALIATITGLGLGGVAIVFFLLGPAPADGLVALLATLAAGEAYRALQRASYRPATLVGLLATPALVAGGYAFGARAIAIVLAGAVVATGLWYLRGTASDEVVVDAAVTMFVIVWIGLLAAFAGLLLSPATHPDRHGVALVVAAMLLTVSHDVGSYAIGARLGRHPLAPRLSPGKTLEGLLGGTVFDLGVAVLVVSRIHPLSMGVALGLGAFVAIFAPLGDLFESAVKRDLRLKDMGSILPAHGGVLDRIDAMLFVLPAAWCLFRLAHIA